MDTKNTMNPNRKAIRALKAELQVLQDKLNAQTIATNTQLQYNNRLREENEALTKKLNRHVHAYRVEVVYEDNQRESFGVARSQ